MELLIDYSMRASRYVLIIMSLAILVRCVRSMLSESYEPEVWAYLHLNGVNLPVCHWENIIGRSLSADVRVKSGGVGRVHAILKRTDNGSWRIYEVFAKGGVWVNSARAGDGGIEVQHGDVINLSGTCLRFLDITTDQRHKLEAARTNVGGQVSPAVTLIDLTVFQVFLLVQHLFSAEAENLPLIALSFGALAALQWLCYGVMRLMRRSGFEVETLAFYLTTLGLSVAASSTPDDLKKQLLLTLAAVLLFGLSGLWMRRLRRTMLMRIPVAVLAVALLAVNVLASDAVFGARNWLELWGYSFQPSEIVKAAYVYVGASTLDRLYHRRNLFLFIGFSAACVIALALIGDFGTALIFFMCFLVISFMRSGSIATVFLAVSGAALAGFLAVTVKPYIAQRFATWGHAWEDVYDKGFQQVRAMSAAAAGGLFGKGAGSGWLKGIFAANTDMVFGVVCEEQGLIIALCMVTAVLTLAFFAVRSARHGRSAFYAIAACAAVSVLLVQASLNVFGSMDLLPFTGVTFPFVSRGGTSLLSCWLLMAYLKAADNRRGASFAVDPVSDIKPAPVMASLEYRDRYSDDILPVDYGDDTQEDYGDYAPEEERDE